ncbi:type II toxin-antitoxin system RelE/ParE family toxin [Patescibacteria group bacterium]|nr:type II toxin-antitoxin system RelE/ParE family toxin [Patescibacteria group bacterium]
MFTLNYHPQVLTVDIPKVNGSWKKKIKGSIEAKLTLDPLLYGKPLRRDLHGCYKLRIGDYRVIYFVKNNEVFIITIGHRRDVYHNNFETRL